MAEKAAGQEDAEEAWEDELEDQFQSGPSGNAEPEVHGWNELRDDIFIKETLSSKREKLTLTQINQLLIIRDLATLHLKAYRKVRKKARDFAAAKALAFEKLNACPVDVIRFINRTWRL